MTTRKTKRVKVKNKWTQTTKRRLILDLRSSGISAASVKCERFVLPRMLDVIFDGLELLRHLRSAYRRLRRRERLHLEHVVLDFANDFFHFPVMKEEQRYLVAQFLDWFWVCFRATQGSRGGPLACGRGLS